MQHQIVQFGNRLTLNSAVSNRASCLINLKLGHKSQK